MSSTYFCRSCNRNVQVEDGVAGSPSCPVCSSPLIATLTIEDEGDAKAQASEYFLG
ncbi:MAG: endonuclease Q family protein [Actinomycetota bacterium]|nr:endonuclease Q family protein [Actinomycetota bacterium]